MPQTIAEYIRSLRQGEESGFNFFFREYYAALAYYSCQIIHVRADAEEIASESLMKLWERRSHFDNLSAIQAFLYTSTRHASLNYTRSRDRLNRRHLEAEYLSEKLERDVFERIVETETYREITGTMSVLPPQCRRIFSMLFIEGKDYQQIAEELQLSVATIRSQKARALLLIRQKLATGFIVLIAGLLSHL